VSKRTIKDLDLDFSFGAHVSRPPTMDWVCEKCVYGSGEHRFDCPETGKLEPVSSERITIKRPGRYGGGTVTL
jgi:hypothetical protein